MTEQAPPFDPDPDLIGEMEPPRYRGKHRRRSFLKRLRSRDRAADYPDACEVCHRWGLGSCRRACWNRPWTL